MRSKFPYVRSFALLKAAREIPCQCCGAQDGTIVAAHSNQAIHGKGRSIKASDIYIASLCAKCHTMVDSSYSMNKLERTRMWTSAHTKTVQELTNRGLWPANIGRP